MLVLLVACNPDLLPLVPVVDAMGLDVVVMLLVAQVAAAWPGLRAGAAGLWPSGGEGCSESMAPGCGCTVPPALPHQLKPTPTEAPLSPSALMEPDALKMNPPSSDTDCNPMASADSPP